MPPFSSQQWKTDVQNNIQRMLSDNPVGLNKFVTTSTKTGEWEKVPQLDRLSMSPRDYTISDTIYSDALTDQRWVTVSNYTVATLEDFTGDVLDNPEHKADYLIKIQQGIVEASRVEIDKLIIENFTTDAKTGSDGSTIVPFPVGNILPANLGNTGAVNLNFRKMNAVATVMMNEGNNISGNEKLNFVVGFSQYEKLKVDEHFSNHDYGGSADTRSARVITSNDFNIIAVPDVWLPLAGNIRTVYAFTKQSMLFRNPRSLRLVVDVLPQKNQATSVWGELNMGAGRIQEGGVFSVLCDESVM